MLMRPGEVCIGLTMLVRSNRAAALCGQDAVGFWPAVAEELPHLANFKNHVQVEIGDQDFILVATGLSKDLATRIAKIALAVELADAPRLLFANPVDGTDEVAVCDRVRRLLQLP